MIRFWAKVDQRDPDECWKWGAATNDDGYGVFKLAGRMEKSHRVAFYLHNGFWPEVCRHSCDNPPCCNPGHLLDGTHADNAQDRVQRGRHFIATGQSSPAARLTDVAVQQIRGSSESQTALAARYGVHQSTISRIINRKAWPEENP